MNRVEDKKPDLYKNFKEIFTVESEELSKRKLTEIEDHDSQSEEVCSIDEREKDKKFLKENFGLKFGSIHNVIYERTEESTTRENKQSLIASLSEFRI